MPSGNVITIPMSLLMWPSYSSITVRLRELGLGSTGPSQLPQILGISGLYTSNLNFSMGLMRTRRMFCKDALLHNQSMVKNGNLFPRPCTTLTNQLKLSCIKWWLYSARKRARSRQGRRPKLMDSSRPFSWLLLFPGYIFSKMFSKVGPLPVVSLVGILFICYSIYL
ncbi:unnamed protein product [Prunus brigantina]